MSSVERHRFDRVLLTKPRAGIFATVSCVLVILLGRALFAYVESLRGHSDDRLDQVTMIFGAIMTILWVFSIVAIARDRRIGHVDPP